MPFAFPVPRVAIGALGAGAGGRGLGLPSTSILPLPVGNVPITKLVWANRKRTPFGRDARALAGVLHACYRFPLTPIELGVEN